MRRIVTAISGVALAFSLVAQAVPAAAAISDFDALYRGESAFLNLNRGDTGSFTVFWQNTGTASWGSSTVVLAACKEDKTTCNAQDTTEAGFNSGWKSATQYASAVQSTVAPGDIGTFTYSVKVPADTAAGTYRFNGSLWSVADASTIHNVGYYQDVTVATAAAAATLTGMSPTSGDLGGGDTVTLTGTGFSCTPSFPTVTFGDAAGTVSACGSTTLTVKSPAHAAGNVTVTATNSGAAASNGLIFTYADQTAPTFDSASAIAGTQTVTLNFSEKVCKTSSAPATDYTITVNGAGRTESSENAVITNCGTSSATGTTSITVAWSDPSTALIAGDTVVVTVTTAGAGKTKDLSNNAMTTAQSRSTTVAADSTKPSISSAAAGTSTTLKLTYSEAVNCGNGAGQVTGTTTVDGILDQFRALTGNSSLKPTSAKCATNATFGTTVVTLTFGSSIASGGSVSYTQSSTATNAITDLAGNKASTPQTVSYSAFTADTTAPTITDAHVTANVGSTNFGDTNDAFTLTFSEKMDTTTAGDKIQVQDNDPGTTKSVATLTCGQDVSCSWDSGATTLTVTVIDTLTFDTAGTTAGLQLPLTILATLGITDEAGNAPNLGGSDKTID